jgi:hypothetical protein
MQDPRCRLRCLHQRLLQNTHSKHIHDAFRTRQSNIGPMADQTEGILQKHYHYLWIYENGIDSVEPNYGNWL